MIHIAHVAAYILFWSMVWAQLVIVFSYYFSMMADCYYGVKNIRYKGWLISIILYSEYLPSFAPYHTVHDEDNTPFTESFDPDTGERIITYHPPFRNCFHDLYGFSDWQTFESFYKYRDFTNPDALQWFCEPVPWFIFMLFCSFLFLFYLVFFRREHVVPWFLTMIFLLLVITWPR